VNEAKANNKLAGWLTLGGIFIAAVAVTVVVGTRGSSDTETTFPDLGDIAAQDPDLPDTSAPAPTFVLPTLGGGTFDLSRHIADDGRPVILNLWASWCGPCRSEMPAIDASSIQHPEVAFIGVAVQDKRSDAVSFVEELGVGYTIAIDDGTVDEAYPALGLPATFFIAGDGTLVKTHFGVVTEESLAEDIATLFG
jgi:thiol-disulfide isomerase/thioredoxin